MDLSISQSSSPASTTDGRYYLRVGDACKPLVGEEVQRLLEGSVPFLEVSDDLLESLDPFLEGIRDIECLLPAHLSSPSG